MIPPVTREHERLAEDALTGHVREDGIRVAVSEAIAVAERRGALRVLERLGPIIADAEVARDELCQEFQP